MGNPLAAAHRRKQQEKMRQQEAPKDVTPTEDIIEKGNDEARRQLARERRLAEADEDLVEEELPDLSQDASTDPFSTNYAQKLEDNFEDEDDDLDEEYQDDEEEEVVEEDEEEEVEVETKEEPTLTPEEKKAIEQPVATESLFGGYTPQEQPKPVHDINQSNAFQKVKAAVPSDPGVTALAEMIEAMVIKQCELSGVSNLDLTTYGIVAQSLKFPTLDIIEYGIHKFLGVRLTPEEQDAVVHNLALHVAKSQDRTIVVKAVIPIKAEGGLTMYSLQFDSEIAQKYADMFRHKVYMNANETDVSELRVVIVKD